MLGSNPGPLECNANAEYKVSYGCSVRYSTIESSLSKQYASQSWQNLLEGKRVHSTIIYEVEYNWQKADLHDHVYKGEVEHSCETFDEPKWCKAKKQSFLLPWKGNNDDEVTFISLCVKTRLKLLLFYFFLLAVSLQWWMLMIDRVDSVFFFKLFCFYYNAFIWYF